MSLEALKSLNPILPKVGDDHNAFAKFVISQLPWTLVCDDSFWYQGEYSFAYDIPEHQVEGVSRATRDICAVLNSALDEYCKDEQYSYLSSVVFTSKDGAIITEVRGVRDVPSKFPVGDLMRAIDNIRITKQNNQALPGDVAMSMYATQLREGLAATAKVPEEAAKPAVIIDGKKVSLPKQSFAAQVRSRENTQQSIAAVAA